MIDIVVKNTIATDSDNIGAVICHTPKSVYTRDNTLYDSDKLLNCKLIKNIDDFVKYYGDPFVDPALYSDLVIAYDLVRRNIPLYISSVNEMYEPDDSDFKTILYNGCTEFYFTDAEGNDTVGYKLKSDIKLCQPIIRNIRLTNNNTILQLFVDLFYIDSCKIKFIEELHRLHDRRLYRTLVFSFDIDSVTDNDIVEEFLNNGLELIIKNASNERSFVECLTNKASAVTTILLDSFIPDDIAGRYTDDQLITNVITRNYWYTINANDYRYDFDDEYSIIAYRSAINALYEMSPSPIMACFGKVLVSKNTFDDQDNCVRTSLVEPDSDSYLGAISLILDKFTSESDTYIFVNTPDISVSSVTELIKNEGSHSDTIRLQENYNADLFFGYVTDFVDTSLASSNPKKAIYSAAIMTFYKLMLERDTYVTNNFVDLNISNRCVKLVISETSARKLSDARCNSIVLFDIGSPSTFGDRSLSLLPSLRYSHISRNFVRLRRIIKEYLESRKFIINTYFNIQSCINYVKVAILGDFMSRGVLSNYTLTYSIENHTVYIHITLWFPSVADSIPLDFTI